MEKLDTIGKRINEIRAAKGLTMRSVAQAAGLSESYLWRIVRGEIGNLRLETIKKIACNGLDLPVSALFGEDGRVVVKINDNRPEWCRNGTMACKIAEAVHQLPKEAQELILVQVESFAKFFARPKRTKKSTAVKVLKGEL